MDTAYCSVGAGTASTTRACRRPGPGRRWTARRTCSSTPASTPPDTATRLPRLTTLTRAVCKTALTRRPRLTTPLERARAHASTPIHAPVGAGPLARTRHAPRTTPTPAGGSVPRPALQGASQPPLGLQYRARGCCGLAHQACTLQHISRARSFTTTSSVCAASSTDIQRQRSRRSPSSRATARTPHASSVIPHCLSLPLLPDGLYRQVAPPTRASLYALYRSCLLLSHALCAPYRA